MKYLFTILIAIVSHHVLFSQVQSSIDFYIESSQSFRTLGGEYSPESQTIIDRRNDSEGSLTNFGFGIHYSQKIGNNFLLRTGIDYLRFGYQVETFNFDWAIARGSIPEELINGSETPNVINFRDLYQYVSIPLNLRYQFGKSRLKPFIEFGPSFGFLSAVRNRVIVDRISSASIDSNESYRQFNIFFQLQVGISYQLNEQLQIFTNIGTRRGLLSTTDGPISTRLYSSMLALGARRLIK